MCLRRGAVPVWVDTTVEAVSRFPHLPNGDCQVCCFSTPVSALLPLVVTPRLAQCLFTVRWHDGDGPGAQEEVQVEWASITGLEMEATDLTMEEEEQEEEEPVILTALLSRESAEMALKGR